MGNGGGFGQNAGFAVGPPTDDIMQLGTDGSWTINQDLSLNGMDFEWVYPSMSLSVDDQGIVTDVIVGTRSSSPFDGNYRKICSEGLSMSIDLTDILGGRV
jgi:hypothetical protein